jgi:hypothetical protein
LVLFKLFHSGQKHRTRGGSIYANIGTNWQKFTARITKWVFATNAPNTLQHVQKSCFGDFWTFSFRSQNIPPVGAQYVPILELIDKSSPRESRSEFLPRTRPIHSNMSENHVVDLFELFHSGQKHRTRGGSIYANIGTNWQNFAARIAKWVFATNAPSTLQHVQKSCFDDFWTFSFRSQNIASVGAQYMPILALIEKSLLSESRSEFLPRTHPIHSNMSENHVLVLFDLFHSGQKHRTRGGSRYANIGTNWQKLAARNTKWVFATNAPNTLQHVGKSCFSAFWSFSFRSKTSHPWGLNICQYWH